jgi:FAD/FMN-containing dehydrogenase
MSLYSWGRYPAFAQQGHSCYWRDDLSAALGHLVERYGSTLVYANGRSYGDSCLAVSDQVLHSRGLSRFIAVDWSTGVVVAEAGVTLAEVLEIAIPQGWFLQVTPGTQFVTLGGAVANDVHGKNHHVRGTFGGHVKRFQLIRSDQAPQICSAQEHPELFRATIGGLGLTGVMAWVELQLMPICSSQIQVGSTRFNSLQEFFQLSNEYDSQHEYTVAWIDCLAKGKSLGRGIFMFGDHAPEGTLQVSRKAKLGVPITPPFSLINPISLRLFNAAYFHKHPATLRQAQMSYEPFFYPLDGIQNWNRIYGKRGFQQYQCVIPTQNAEAAVRELLATIAVSGGGSFLVVLKRCGDVASPGLLSFPMPGVSLALDFPQHNHLNFKIFARMDAIVRQANGRLYPAKDAHMSPEDFRRFYPEWLTVEALRDPGLYSRFWKRVTLK